MSHYVGFQTGWLAETPGTPKKEQENILSISSNPVVQSNHQLILTVDTCTLRWLHEPLPHVFEGILQLKKPSHIVYTRFESDGRESSYAP